MSGRRRLWTRTVMTQPTDRGSSFSRSVKDLEKDRERDSRRARGLISCAECRRLKLKCDKLVPCSSCVRRGCMSLCPNDVQSSKANPGTRPSHRPRLADKEKLRAQVVEMGERIRKLENELRILHSCHSSDIHPLLSEDLLRVKTPTESDKVTYRAKATLDVDDQLLESFGTLAVSDRGTERFVGAAGTTERLLQLESQQFRGFPPPVSALDDQYPSNWLLISGSSNCNEIFIELLRSHLPSRQRAEELCEAYLENVSWFCRPVRRDQVMEELLPDLYSDHLMQMDIHDLALVLATLSAGAASDLALPAYNEESELYHDLSMRALSMKPFLDSDGVSLSTVQTLMLGGIHHLVSGRMNSLEPVWKIQSCACVLALSIGLHRDPANWNLEAKHVQRRRQVFWELFVVDKWKSLSCGRPPSFKLDDIDCLFPDDTDATVDQNGNIIASPWHWRFRFCKEVTQYTAQRLCSSIPVTYSDVLEMDRIIEDFGDNILIPALEAASQVYERQYPGDKLRFIAVCWYQHISLIHVHRGFFAEALMKSPMNPLESPFAHSFSAAYRGSVKLLGVLRTWFDEMPHLLLRLWPMWAHGLTAAVIVGSVALHCQGSSMAAPATIELDHAISLFEKATVHPVVETGLPILLRLRHRARNSARQHTHHKYDRHGNANTRGYNGVSDRLVDSDSDHELSILRGVSDLIAITSSCEPSKKQHQRQHAATQTIGDRHQKSGNGSDPFGLFQYGGMSASQFVTEEQYPESLEVMGGNEFLFGDVSSEQAGSPVQSLPEDTWQSFMQSLGVGEMHTI